MELISEIRELESLAPSLDVVLAVGMIAGAVLASIVTALMVWGGSKL